MKIALREKKINESNEILIEDEEVKSSESIEFDLSYISQNKETEKKSFKLTKQW